MFDLLAKLVCSIATFAFPIFASYKALKANDPSQLTPWLMYWVVLACLLCVESWVGWAVSWIPFYEDVRACFMLWLVLPQTQGATKLYFEYVHPTLTKHEADIEEFISRAHDQAKAAGAEYIQRFIELAKQALFGALPPAPERPQTPAPHDAASFAQQLFSRWKVPPLGPYAPQLATDFYTFLSSALQQQTAGAQNTSNLIPDHFKSPTEKARFIELQRQRLKMAMSALDNEMETIRDAGGDIGGIDAAAASEDAGSGGLYKSYSQGHLSMYEGDFDHVSMADASAEAAPTAAAVHGWLWGWGSKNTPEKPHQE